MSFYKLPHPWNPGYVIPDYVMAEPPERGAFVTQWLPRGTISEVVPDYFAERKTGRKILGRSDAQLGSLAGTTLSGNTLGGHTLACTSLSGHSLGATEYELMPTGNAGDPAMLANYGKYTARGVIAKVKALPPQHRATALKQAMDRIDPTLHARTSKHAAAAKARGVPGPKALEYGMAKAMSEGVTGELARLGKSRSMPHPSSLLGVGLTRARSRAQGAMSNYVGVGAIDATIATNIAEQIDPLGTVMQQLAAARVRLADTLAGASTGTTAVAQAKVVSDLQAKAFTLAKGHAIEAGPFQFPSDTTKSFALELKTPADLARLPEAQKTFIRDALLHGAGDDGPWRPTNFKLATVPAGPNGGKPMFPGYCDWIAAVGLDCNQKLAQEMILNTLSIGTDQIGDHIRSPLVTFTHPITGNEWGIFFVLAPSATTSSTLGVATPLKGYLFYTWLPDPSWIHGLGHWIKHIPANIGKGLGAVAGAVGSIVGFVGDETCKLLGTPGAAGAAAAANPAAGAGVAIAGKLCGNKAPVLPPQQQSSPLLPILLIGGGLLAAIAVATKDD